MLISELEKLQDPNMPLDSLAAQDKEYINSLAGKISEDGLQEPITIIVGPTGKQMIWDGHHRLLALKMLGNTDAPVIFKESMTFGLPLQDISNENLEEEYPVEYSRYLEVGEDDIKEDDFVETVKSTRSKPRLYSSPLREGKGPRLLKSGKFGGSKVDSM